MIFPCPSGYTGNHPFVDSLYHSYINSVSLALFFILFDKINPTFKSLIYA